MKRLLVLVVGLSLLLVGGALIAPGFVDWNKYKPQILTQLKEATGHEYRIEGDLNLAVLPFPQLSIAKLSVATPVAGGAAVSLAQLERMTVQLALTPLFSGDIVVQKILLQNPVFNLSIAADGTPSWMTPALAAKTGAGKAATAGSGVAAGIGADIGNSIALKQISIRDGSFQYDDRRSGKEFALAGVNASLQGDSLFGPYNLEGDFVYEQKKVKIALKSGRVDKLAEAVSLQLTLGLPDMATIVSYSGVFALKEGQPEFQGETGLDTPDLAALMLLASKQGKPADNLKKPLSVKGILSFSKQEIAYRNLKFAFSGLDGTGYAVIKNFAVDAKGPLDVNLVAEAAKPVALESLLPPPAAKGKAASGFIPESFTFPRTVSGAVNFKAPAVSYAGMSFQDVAFSFDSREKGFGGQLNLKAPGGGVVDINSALAFGAQTVSEKTGSVTYSDPALTLEIKGGAEEPLALVQSLVKTPLAENVKKALANNLAAEMQLTVRPRSISIGDSYLKLAETRVNGKGTFTKGSAQGRDRLSLSLANFGFDVDEWQKKIAPPVTGAVENATPKPDIKALAGSLKLPFDLDFAAEFQGVRIKGRDYSRLAAKGKLAGTQLTLDTLEANSNSGDTAVIAGGIKNLAALSGIDLTLQASLVDTVQTLQSFGIGPSRLPANIGKSELLAEAKGPVEKLAFTANLKALRASLEASGEIADALAAPKFSDLTLRLQHPSYVEMARIFNPQFNSGVAVKKNLDLFASMSRKGNIYSFSQLQAVIGPATIKGDVIADLGGAKPQVTAALEMGDLPLDDLFGIRAGAKGVASSGSGGQKQGDSRWSRNAINTAFLHTANIDLKATANSIKYGNWVFKNAGLNINLKDGLLDLRQLDGGLAGGSVALTGTLKSENRERQPLVVAGKILAQGVSLEEFVKSFSGSQLVKARGAVTVESSLQASGISPAALVFDLNGKGTAAGQNIVFEGFDLARLSGALANASSSFTENFTRLLDASLAGGSTSFDKLDGVFTVTEGVINFDKMDLTGPTADVATRGTVSLPLWSMDLESTIQLKEPADAPPLRASFKGPLDKPARTFGQNAMQQYFQRQLEGTVISPLLDKIDDSGTLQNLLGIPGRTKQVPQQVPPPQPVQVPPPVDAPAAPDPAAQPVAPAPVQPQAVPAPQKELTPEEALFGVIKGVLGE